MFKAGKCKLALFDEMECNLAVLEAYVGVDMLWHSGKSATIRESNHGSGVCKEHYA